MSPRSPAPYFDALDAFAHLDDYPGELVPHHHGELHGDADIAMISVIEPQMPVALTSILTSPKPGDGSGTSDLHVAYAAAYFTNAFITTHLYAFVTANEPFDRRSPSRRRLQGAPRSCWLMSEDILDAHPHYRPRRRRLLLPPLHCLDRR